MRTLLTVTLGLCLLGCDDPLAYPQDIDRLRVLGARVSVNGDSRRAWPRPGDSVSLEWLVVDPEPEPQLGWRFEVCPGTAGSRGLPECADEVFASAEAFALSPEAPRFDFDVPGVVGERLLVQGLVCKGALASDSGCGERARVLFELTIAADGRENDNPTLADAPMTLDGKPWPEATPGELAQGSCIPGASAPSIAGGEQATLRLVLDAMDRDATADSTGLSPKHEALSVSHFSTRGRLSRALSIIEGDSNELEASVPWRAPTAAGGERVRFYFVVRDGRGGVDWSARTLCLGD